MDKSMAGIHEERKSEGVFQNSLETLRSVSATLGGLYPSSRRRLSSPCPPSNSPLASYVSLSVSAYYITLGSSSISVFLPLSVTLSLSHFLSISYISLPLISLCLS